jgi:hypothetical protein
MGLQTKDPILVHSYETVERRRAEWRDIGEEQTHEWTHRQKGNSEVGSNTNRDQSLLHYATDTMSWMKNMLPDMGGMGDMMKMMPTIAKAKQAMENAKGTGQSRGSSCSPTSSSFRLNSIKS